MKQTTICLIMIFLCMVLLAKTSTPVDIVEIGNNNTETRALGLAYTLLEDGTGYSVARGFATATDIVIPATYNFLPVKVIEQSAFINFTGLTTIHIPEGVTTIGAYAFYGCENLTAISLPSTVTYIIPGWNIYETAAFYDCNSIASIDVHPDNPVYRSEGNCLIKRISNSVVLGCQNSVIPEGVEGIDMYAFRGCPGLTSIDIPQRVVYIAPGAFYVCENLASVTISESVLSIYDRAFYGCTGLTSIEVHPDNPFYRSEGNCLITASDILVFGCQTSLIPSSVISVGPYAFYYCLGLTSIDIPTGVIDISDHAFEYCNNLVSVNISSGVITIGERAFADCRSLTSIVIPEGVTSLGENAFYYCEKLESVTLPSSLDSIAHSTFDYCLALSSVIISEGLTSIGARAFNYCYYLRDITLPNSLTTIEAYAFENCNRMKTIDIPTSVTSIGMYAFISCLSLTIFTELESAPVGWDPLWNGHNRPVVWGSAIGELTFTPLSGGYGYEVSGATSRAANIVIPSSYNGMPVTAFAYGGFISLTNLTSIYIPSTVTDIYQNPFNGSDNLISIEIDPANPIYRSEGNCIIQRSNNTVIAGCAGSIIPSGVTSIGPYAFANCINLENIDFPESLTTIGASAFALCSSLRIIDIPANVTSIGQFAFSYCSNVESLTIANPSTNIGMIAFTNLTSLTSVSLPNGITTIGSGMFLGCNSLTSITIPTSVTSIGESAFERCTGLSGIIIPSNVNSIAASVFYGCSNLRRIVVQENNSTYRSEGNCLIRNADNALIAGCNASIIPDGVVSIGNGAFSGLATLTNVNIPSSVTSIGNSAFRSCRNLTNVNIQGNITTIANSAFAGCDKLVTINLPSSLLTIGIAAFDYCHSLNAINFPEGLESIGSEAFRDCDSLTSINFPNSVTNIGNYAFKDCTGLSFVNIPSTVIQMGSAVFDSCRGLVVFTPLRDRPDTWSYNWLGSGYGYYLEVVWGYTNAPLPPTNLAYNVSNAMVELAWTAPEGVFIPSFEAYSVYRDNELLATDLTNPSFTDETPLVGEHIYYVCATYTTGVSEPSNAVTVSFSTESDQTTMPITMLTGNYPNPFNPATTIAFYMARESHVTLEVYNTKGQRVAILVDGVCKVGAHKVVWNGCDTSGKSVASGVYFYRMVSDDYVEVKKMVMVK